MRFPLATNNIVLDRPIIGWDEVKSLTLDGTRATFKGDYAAVWKFYLGEPPKRSLSRSQEFLND